MYTIQNCKNSSICKALPSFTIHLPNFHLIIHLVILCLSPLVHKFSSFFFCFIGNPLHYCLHFPSFLWLFFNISFLISFLLFESDIFFFLILQCHFNFKWFVFLYLLKYRACLLLVDRHRIGYFSKIWFIGLTWIKWELVYALHNSWIKFLSVTVTLHTRTFLARINGSISSAVGTW